MPESTEISGAIDAALGPLLAEPATAAVLLDFDGTLAPIVARPEDAAISERTRAALRGIASRYGLVAVVTGRPALVARGIVALDELLYAGNHGFEVLVPGAAEPEPAPAVREHAADAAAFLSSRDGEVLADSGVRVEDKGAIVALHWRGAADPERAEAAAVAEAVAAEAGGLVTHRGRMVLELRPPVAIDKGTAVAGLLAEGPIRSALYVGDDRTDLDAYRALARLRDEGALEHVVRVAVRSTEGPDELIDECDVAVSGPGAIPPLLEALAG